MGVPKRLTEMQQRFAEYLVFGGPEGPLNKSEAAELAGYSKKRCRQEGSELTNPRLSPLVVKHIDELKQERMLKFGVTYESHIAELARLIAQSIKKEIPLLGEQARVEVIENWSAKKEAVHLMKLYQA